MTKIQSPFAQPEALPFYEDSRIYNLGGGTPRPYEFNGWKPESLSWKRSCYIHAGLSGPGQFIYEGPEAADFLSSICVNSFAKFRAGTAKHAIMCTEEGLIAGHGVLQRLEEERFRLFVAGPWSRYMLSKSKFDVRETVENNFLFQVAGPASLAILESLSGENLSDIRFLRYRNIRIDGREVQIMRMGMAGTLAYELHGELEDGPAVYDAVYEAGRIHGIERLGWMTYGVNHVEGGFPQQSWTFLAASHSDPGFRKYVDTIKPVRWTEPMFSGSVDPANTRARHRTPHELGWQNSIRFDHDFVGKAALEAEAKAPQRTIVTLEWDTEDIIDIYASMFRPGDEYKHLELPTSPHFRGILAVADRVTKDGKDIGIASGTIYSYYFRKVLSLCTIDIAQAQIGNEVIVHWGEYGARIKEVRARVARYPYLNEGRNEIIDPKSVSTVA
ncbi:MAG: hypothetical protein R3C51_12090 [Parvularculaceae bacterium]